MDIKEAANELKLSQRHIRRLIESGVLPAKRVKKLVEMEVWEIDDNAIDAALRTLGGWQKYEQFFDWMTARMKELGLTYPELSKRIKLPILEIVNDDAMIKKLNSGESEVRDKIIAAFLRVIIERGLHDA